MSLATQIIDQRVSGLVTQMADILANELKLGADEDKKRSAAFVSLVAKTVLNLTDEEAIEGIVDGGNDFGVDALFFTPPSDGEIRLTLIQGKYKRSLDGDSTFPENGIIKLIDAIGALFDPGKILTLNKRLRDRVEDIRSFVAEGPSRGSWR